jgi:hypothetical protein
MHPGEQYSAGASASGTGAASSTDQAQREAGGADETTRQEPPKRSAASRLLMALAWTLGAAGVFFLFLRVDLTAPVSSDAANNALQAWDLLHGHLLLHGWLIGDATYYTFDLPVIALAEVFFGLHTIAMHVAIALIYLIVAIAAVAIAVTGASGAAARLSRAAVVVAMLAAPALILSDRWVTLGIPDHTGTTIFLLVPALLVDRATTRRWGAPLLCVILTAGQIGDVTVRYVAVPAVCLVCAYQILAARKIRTGDAAMLIAAIVSLPLTTAVRAVMRHFGSYLMVSPKTKLAPTSEWGHNARLTWHSLRELFGSQAAPTPHAVAGHWTIFGSVCLVVAAAMAALIPLSVIASQPSAGAGEQQLLVEWLESHGLHYGLGGYWNASGVTLLAADGVQIRTVKIYHQQAVPYPWECSELWYEPSLHYANFLVQENNDPQTLAIVKQVFGKPVLTHRVGGITVLVYHKNLLDQVTQFSQLKAPVMPPVS